jgi:hypothetical protein
VHSAFSPATSPSRKHIVHGEQLQHSYTMPLDTIYLTRHGVCALRIHLCGIVDLTIAAPPQLDH